jgi:hypothetical protein
MLKGAVLDDKVGLLSKIPIEDVKPIAHASTARGSSAKKPSYILQVAVRIP